MAREPRAPREEKQFDERVVAVDRVARVVKGGRRFRFRALVVIGDGKGKIGTGVAKGADVTAAVAKATGIRNIISKSLGSSNKINVAYATVDALKAIQPHSKWHTTGLEANNKTDKKSEKVVKADDEKKSLKEEK